VIVALQAPAALLVSFVPMFLIAGAFFYMNRADPDAGTTFSWVTRALGPWAGWIGGWAVFVTGILVIGSLADVGARYLYLIVGWDSAAASKEAVTALAVGIVVVMTAICILGTELSARVQTVMILAQVGSLLLFAIVAIVRVYSGDATADSIEPQWSWLNPFEIDSRDALVQALLVGVFIYWGWESAVNLTEECEDAGGRRGSQRSSAQ
jgi:amino acid transporter